MDDKDLAHLALSKVILVLIDHIWSMSNSELPLTLQSVLTMYHRKFKALYKKPEIYRQSVPITSNPMGAEVYVDGQKVGVTPLSIDLERSRNHLTHF